MTDYLSAVEPDFPSLFPLSNDFEYTPCISNKMPHAVSSSIHHSLPAILCLHGAGTSAAIFEAQTRNIRVSLRSHYRFIYIDAPYDSAPGPGVVPCFEDSGPFYGWICDEPSLPTPGTAASGLASLSKYISTTLSHQGVNTSDIVGVMGFSQGTIVASLLLLQAQWRDVRWSGLQFGVMLSGACREDFVQAFLGQKLRIPTVHVHGLRDPYLGSSRMLAKEVYCDKWAKVLECDAGHHVPAKGEDLEKLTGCMREMRRRSRIKANWS